MKKNNILKLLITFVFALILSTNVYAAEIKGDLDGDGEVTAYDAYLSLLVVQEDEDAIEVTEENVELIDIDSDKEVTEEDTQLILDYSVDIVENPTMWVIEDESESVDESINRFYYNQLDQYEKAIYDGIMNDLEYVESKNGAFINLGESLNDVAQGKTDKELKDVVQNAYYAIHYDQPGLFYLDRISLTSASTYKNGQIVTIYGAKTYLTADAKSDIAGIQTDKTRMETIKNNAVKAVSGMNDYDKLLYLHDFIVNNTNYVSDAQNRYNALGCLIEKKAVCEGYALAYKYLCNAAGIQCEMIVSDTHAWNAVYLNNAWYYVDTTWDDPVGYSGATRHTYFLRGSDYMSKVDQHQLYKVGSLIYPNVSKTDYNK